VAADCRHGEAGAEEEEGRRLGDFGGEMDRRDVERQPSTSAPLLLTQRGQGIRGARAPRWK
jgi:hypothetical protein